MMCAPLLDSHIKPLLTSRAQVRARANLESISLALCRERERERERGSAPLLGSYARVRACVRRFQFEEQQSERQVLAP